jgi:hypothetical protein
MATHDELPAQPRFRSLRLGEVRPTGWIQAQMTRDLEQGFAGHLDQLTTHAANDLFRHRIGSSGDEIQWWDSETRGNWMIGLTQMAYLARHPATMELVDRLLASLKSTQDDDGYLGIYVPGARYNHPPGENGELWSQSRALLALLSYFELTGDASYLAAAERSARLTSAQYGPHRRYFDFDPARGNLYLTGLTHGLMYAEAMEWLYDLTGEPSYRDFGVWLYRDYCSVPGYFRNDDLKLDNLLNSSLPLRGHAAHPAEHLRVLVWASVMTGEEEMAQGVAGAYRKLVRYTVPSGGLIGDEDIHGLPLPDVGYEYCTMFELMNSLMSTACKLGGAGYADWAENIALNAAQGARLADGTAICYVSTENRAHALAEDLDTYSAGLYEFSPPLATLWESKAVRHWQHAGRHKFSPTHEDVAVCCNPNAVRLMPFYVSRMWLRGNPGETGSASLAACLYGPCVLETVVAGVPVTIEERTDYPFTEEIKFNLQPAQEVEFDLLLRLPSWATGYRLEASGAAVQEDAGYLCLRKRWKGGDEVMISFDAKIDLVRNANGEYTVRRGPLQYALPIPHRLRPIKDYPVAAFHDYAVVPQEVRQAYQIPILDEAQADWGCEFVRFGESGANPWAEPAVTIRLDGQTLVPLGCTVLRRSTLPLETSGAT